MFENNTLENTKTPLTEFQEFLDITDHHQPHVLCVSQYMHQDKTWHTMNLLCSSYDDAFDNLEAITAARVDPVNSTPMTTAEVNEYYRAYPETDRYQLFAVQDVREDDHLSDTGVSIAADTTADTTTRKAA